MLLTIEGLTQVFPGQVALNAIGFTLWAGRTRALVGQNGSGESTPIKILAGSHRPMRRGAIAAQLLGDQITPANIQRALLASDAPSTIGAT